MYGRRCYMWEDTMYSGVLALAWSYVCVRGLLQSGCRNVAAQASSFDLGTCRP